MALSALNGTRALRVIKPRTQGYDNVNGIQTRSKRQLSKCSERANERIKTSRSTGMERYVMSRSQAQRSGPLMRVNAEANTKSDNPLDYLSLRPFHSPCTPRTRALGRRARLMSKSESSSPQPGASTNPTGLKPPNSDVSRMSSLARTVWDFIRPQPWVINNIRQRKSQKILFRSWLAGWAALIIMLPTRSLQTFGNLYVELAFLVCGSLCS